MTGGFSIEEERQGQGHRLVLDGELDLAAAYDLETALSRLCDDGGRIELDLSLILMVSKNDNKKICSNLCCAVTNLGFVVLINPARLC